MPYTNINKSSDYFNTKLYTGNNTSTNAITGVGFQPDWTWIKVRNTGDSHRVYDAVRGASNYITPNATVAQGNSYPLTSFDSDGFTIGSSDTSVNGSYNYVSWNWKANGQGSANSDGTITTTYTSANTTAGISIIQYTGNSTSGATIGHGLGVEPSVYFCKKTNSAGDNWGFYHKSLGATKYLLLNTNDAGATSSAPWNDTAPTSSVITLGNSTAVNGNTDTFIGYAFAEKKGFSKFGSYTGSGSDLFVYTGFKPALMICKKTDSADNFKIVDNKRSPFNVMDDTLATDTSNAEASPEGGVTIDFLSNGFAFKSMSNAAFNASGGSYVYMAFAEAPLVGSNNVPCVAR